MRMPFLPPINSIDYGFFTVCWRHTKCQRTRLLAWWWTQKPLLIFELNTDKQMEMKKKRTLLESPSYVNFPDVIIKQFSSVDLMLSSFPEHEWLAVVTHSYREPSYVVTLRYRFMKQLEKLMIKDKWMLSLAHNGKSGDSAGLYFCVFALCEALAFPVL